METIRGTMLVERSLKGFTRLLQATNLWEYLQGEGPHTVLAPNASAVKRLPENLLASLRREKWRLREVLAYHIIPDRVSLGDFLDMEFARTVNGQMLRIRAVDGGARLDGSRMLRSDIVCLNGYLHIIDAFLWPK